MNLSASVVNISTNPVQKLYVYPLINKNPVGEVKPVQREPEFIDTYETTDKNAPLDIFDTYPGNWGANNLKNGARLGRVIDIYA
jgi:hypothetical protein